jgi:phosphoadenosine phosphosulfate reductase
VYHLWCTVDKEGKGDIMPALQDQLQALAGELAGKTAVEQLAWAAATFPGKLAFASSLGAEDQVLTDLIARHNLPIPIFTLDTGRLFQESYDLLERTERKYGIKVKIMFPDAGEVERMTGEHGVNLFRESVELRKLCCGVRKIAPLRRALAGLDLWIVGLRREQSVTRTALDYLEWDAGNGLLKLSPLADWSEEQTWDYIKANGVPYHALHDQGFPSIGCACCTRAIQPGEDIRAGRWWWENPEHKECGLHNRPGFGGKATSAAD